MLSVSEIPRLPTPVISAPNVQPVEIAAPAVFKTVTRRFEHWVVPFAQVAGCGYVLELIAPSVVVDGAKVPAAGKMSEACRTVESAGETPARAATVIASV